MRAKQHVYPYQEAPQNKELPLATQLRGPSWLMKRPLRNRREACRWMVSTTGQLTGQLSNVIKRHRRTRTIRITKVICFYIIIHLNFGRSQTIIIWI